MRGEGGRERGKEGGWTLCLHKSLYPLFVYFLTYIYLVYTYIYIYSYICIYSITIKRAFACKPHEEFGDDLNPAEAVYKLQTNSMLFWEETWAYMVLVHPAPWGIARWLFHASRDKENKTISYSVEHSYWQSLEGQSSLSCLVMNVSYSHSTWTWRLLLVPLLILRSEKSIPKYYSVVPWI